jgi:hypothetical protein
MIDVEAGCEGRPEKWLCAWSPILWACTDSNYGTVLSEILVVR